MAPGYMASGLPGGRRMRVFRQIRVWDAYNHGVGFDARLNSGLNGRPNTGLSSGLNSRLHTLLNTRPNSRLHTGLNPGPNAGVNAGLNARPHGRGNDPGCTPSSSVVYRAGSDLVDIADSGRQTRPKGRKEDRHGPDGPRSRIQGAGGAARRRRPELSPASGFALPDERCTNPPT
jgi:hypothetical protein